MAAEVVVAVEVAVTVEVAAIAEVAVIAAQCVDYYDPLAAEMQLALDASTAAATRTHKVRNKQNQKWGK